MASSGTVTTSSYDGRYYYVKWTQTQNVSANTSTISCTLGCAGGNVSYYAERTLNVITGATYRYQKTDKVYRYAGDIATFSFTATHNSDGSCSFPLAINAAVYYSTVNCTGSATITLNSIARESTLNITRSSTDLGTATTITVSRQSTSFTHGITAYCGSNSASVVSYTSTSTSISYSPPISWASNNTTGTSVSVKYTIITYSGTTQIGSAQSKTFTYTIPSSCVPSVALSVSDSTVYLSTYGAYVKSKSKFYVVLTPTLSYSSPIASYSTTANGVTYTSSSFTTGTLSSSGTLTISAKVTDSRGRSGSKSASYTVLSYTAPTISSLSVYRCTSSGTADETGAYMKIVYSASITSLNSNNSKSFKLQYKKTTSSSYTTYETYTSAYSVSSRSAIISASVDYSYDVKITATDDFTSTTKTGSVSTGFAIMHFNAEGNGMALGKVCEDEDCLEIGFPTTLSSTLAVSGATTLSSTLKVTGATTLSSTLAVSGATTLSSTLKVTGATTLSSTLAVSGATTLSSTLKVTGATTLSSSLTANSTVYLNSTVYDAYSTRIRNGLAYYTGSGDTSGINPNTTLEHIILTNHSNTPDSSVFWYIKTEFYSTKSTSANRCQTATGYSAALGGRRAYRVYYGGSWTSWYSTNCSKVWGAINHVAYYYGHMYSSGTTFYDRVYMAFGVRTGSSTTVEFGIDAWQSDERLKDDIQPTSINAIDCIKKIEHISFKWKGASTTHSIGFSAQQLETIDGVKEAVYDVEQTDENAEYDTIKQIHAGKIIPYISKAVQELIEIVEKQQETINTLTETVKELKEEVAAIESKLNN